ncbi:MAG: ribbon-helix-helix domain-containing protein [Lamprobacter sp.]|uniref:ribbon-helix-helix domain-containing protein n=1 Tax=Lamprobacter sp. TaxID=3100796 RepID=UPI002B2629A4|nr:ribbon-helix-helix domain-containing protein [Lamprobacter sp.]MEA3644339.1 ribbon-helix-helix domain-containing protein [Lamprobacter sp.]
MKKGNLSAALSQFDKRSERGGEEGAMHKPAPSKEPTKPMHRDAEREEATRSQLPPSRRGKKALTGYFEPEVMKQLKVMAAAEETTIQALLTEALNDLFKKYGKPHIA